MRLISPEGEMWLIESQIALQNIVLVKVGTRVGTYVDLLVTFCAGL